MKEKLNIFFLCFFIAVFVAAAAIWLVFSYRYRQQLSNEEHTYKEIQNKLIRENTWKDTDKISFYDNSNDNSENTRNKNIKTSHGLDIAKIPDVDFNSIKKYNNDIYAWIQIPKLGISYPVLQHRRINNYYLTHNLDKSFGYPGCIFSETGSKKDFSDALTVLYGHNMKNGSMFGMLHRFDNTDFSKVKCYINIITPISKIRYKIVTNAVWGTKNIPSSFKNSDEGLIKLLNTVRLNLSHKNTIHLKKSISSKNQHMLVLSTCGSNDRSRFLIIALKQNEWRIKF